jgi:outer membrane protein assembly factor BamA
LGLLPPAAELASEEGAAAKKSEWFAAPLIFSNPTLGTGLVLVGGRIMRLHPNARPSVLGLALMGSDNKSWFIAGAGKTYLKDDRWSMTAGLGYGEIRYDLTLPPIPNVGTIDVPLRNRIGVFAGNALRRIGDTAWSTGLRFSATHIENAYDGDLPAGSPISADDLRLSTSAAMLGLQLDFDTTDDSMSKQKGILGRVTLDQHGTNDHDEYQKLKAQINSYFPWHAKHVLAARISGQGSFGEVPFYALSYLGQGSDLRGYRYGSHYAKHLIAIQAEERWQFASRWSLVGFAGAAWLGNDWDDLRDSETLGNLGAGIRFAIAPANRLHLRLDVAYTDDDDSAFLLALGEAY